MAAGFCSGLILFVLACLATACTRNKLENRLVRIDSLVENGLNDSAFVLLKQIDAAQIKTEKERAYYNLLKTEIPYKLYLPVTSDTLIDRSIKYYEKHSDNRKLANAYYYKGMIAYEDGKEREAVLLLKKAEQIADEKDIPQMHKINESIGRLNQTIGASEETLKYAKKARYYGHRATDRDLEIYPLFMMAYAYLELGNTDSAWICTKEAEPLVLESANEHTKYYYLTFLANFYYTVDKEKASRLLDEALKLNPHAETFRTAGQVCFDNGDYDAAETFWKKALDPQNHPQATARALTGLINIKRLQKKYKEAEELSQTLIALNDSVQRSEKKQGVKETQIVFDKDVKLDRQRKKLSYALWTLAILAVCTITVYAYYRHKATGTKRRLIDFQNEIDARERRIAALSAGSDTGRKEIIKLRKEIRTLQDNMTKAAANGRKRYLEIENGGTTYNWEKRDFADYAEYYKLIDGAYVEHLLSDYDNLTEKQIFFAIMCHAGKSDSDIARIMGVAQSSLRTNKMRINAKHISNAGK